MTVTSDAGACFGNADNQPGATAGQAQAALHSAVVGARHVSLPSNASEQAQEDALRAAGATNRLAR